MSAHLVSRRRTVSAAVAAGLVGSLGAAAHAGISYGFTGVSNNNATDTANAVSQLSMSVAAGPGADQVSFSFFNVGAAAMSITDIYFDDGTLLGIASIDDSDPGVDFSQNAVPPILPGGNTLSPPFVVSAGFSAQSDPPVQPNGVNPGESLSITFDLLPGIDFADTLDALDGGLALRVGIRVQGFAGEGSESLVNVPAPSAAVLLALGGLASSRRRR